MLIGFQEFIKGSDHGSRFDVCIAGGGVAGITLALEFARANKRVLLLEGGDIDFTEASQDLYAGKNVGRDYYDLDVSRLRYLGGTSNHWAGFCVPLDDVDFEVRPDIESSGWPISKADLSPWLAPAADILEIKGDFRLDELVEAAENNLRRFETELSPPVRFGEKYADQLKANENIVAVLNASVIDIGVDTATGAVVGFEVVQTDDPSQKAHVVADRFVLALGGIENARLLLTSNKQIERGIGNDHDLVGRYFMEHIEVDLGFALLNGSMTELFDNVTSDERAGQSVLFAATRDFQRAASILNCEMRVQALEARTVDKGNNWKSRIKSMICGSDTALDLLGLVGFVDEDFKYKKCRHTHRDYQAPVDEFDAVIMTRSEQAPNYHSRVMLSDERDRLGMRRVALNWQLLDVDKATMRESILELGRYFAATDIGRIRLADWLLDEDQDIAGMADGERGAGYHHIGTTRMASSPSQGVVDRDGKVFGTPNLYIAGSSVFPTGGHAPPTLTIVQLALRLANHLTA